MGWGVRAQQVSADLSSPARCLFSQLIPDGCDDSTRPSVLGPMEGSVGWGPPPQNFFRKKKPAQSGSSLLWRERKSERDVVKHSGRLFFLHEGTDGRLWADRWLPVGGGGGCQRIRFSRFHEGFLAT